MMHTSILVKQLDLLGIKLKPVSKSLYFEFLQSRLRPNDPKLDEYYQDLKKAREFLEINPADYYLVPKDYMGG